MFWVDRQGKEMPLPLPPRSYLYAHLSPDGKQLALEIEGPSHNFYLYDFARGVLTKMSFDGLSHAPMHALHDRTNVQQETRHFT